ncbi:MAG TPA: histidine kinase [Euzebyales bacterium]|nr:histidine kinase [Euzebyales bacterium]
MAGDSGPGRAYGDAVHPAHGRRPPSRRRDLLIAGVAAWVAVGGSTFVAQRMPPQRPLDWLAYLLLIGSAGALVARRRHPVTVLVVVGACTVAFGAAGYASGGPFVLPLMVALFTAVSLGHRTPAIAVAAIFLASFVAAAALEDGRAREALPFVPGWTVAVLVAGEVARSRGDFHAEARRRAEEAERTREEEMRRRATEERLRIAREVHDVLSHSISMINVQAGVAVHLLDSRPEQARTALVAIKQASKDALRDLRATLGVLRHDEGEDDRDPARGLARIDELVSGARSAGVVLEVTTRGDPRALPAGVDLAAYRIVQQSVSNIVRHAGAATGTVDLAYAGGALTIVVENAPGTREGDGGPGGGSGIPGMRERAEALGGELSAGPLPDGGFRVRARLPVGDDGADDGGRTPSAGAAGRGPSTADQWPRAGGRGARGHGQRPGGGRYG